MDDNKQVWEGIVYAFCQAMYYAVIALAVIFAALVCCSCTTTKYVEVPGPTRTEVRHTRDTVEITDTLIDHRETIIRQADSATMAKFGIQISGMEKAWLIQTQALQREINRLKEAHSDTVHVTDSVPYPVEVPVEKIVEAPLSWWQQLRLWLSTALLALCGLAAAYGAFKLWRRFG